MLLDTNREPASDAKSEVDGEANKVPAIELAQESQFNPEPVEFIPELPQEAEATEEAGEEAVVESTPEINVETPDEKLDNPQSEVQLAPELPKEVIQEQPVVGETPEAILEEDHIALAAEKDEQVKFLEHMLAEDGDLLDPSKSEIDPATLNDMADQIQ